MHQDIKYIEGMKEYVAYHTSDGRKLSLESLKNLENSLSGKHFVRVHKSYIVNLKHVKAIEGNMIHVGEQKIPIGLSYKEAFMNKL
ncbi:MAG: LytTR family DNA-binding domain-containing protein [Putridiphycobacter sp.]|nr:LytTR family DNA-binding domain-containing protein [Putridiphycobacter sp.]